MSTRPVISAPSGGRPINSSADSFSAPTVATSTNNSNDTTAAVNANTTTTVPTTTTAAIVKNLMEIDDDSGMPLAESEYNINKITEIQSSFVGGQVSVFCFLF